MQPHELRVVEEQRELDEKIEKLATFVEGPIYRKMSEKSQSLLTQQYSAMRTYSEKLGERIALFEV